MKMDSHLSSLCSGCISVAFLSLCHPVYTWLVPVVGTQTLIPSMRLHSGGINPQSLNHREQLLVRNLAPTRKSFVNARSRENKTNNFNDFFTARSLNFKFVAERWQVELILNIYRLTGLFFNSQRTTGCGGGVQDQESLLSPRGDLIHSQ